MAKTEQGKLTRAYFIDAENKWKLAQKIAPQVASDVEMMMLKIELAKLEAQKEVAIAQTSQSDLQLIQFRHYISTALPEHQQQKVLGYSEVKVVETRDRLVSNGVVINDGSTINKTELCKKLGFIAKSGSPDYKALNLYLAKMPEEAFETIQYLKESPELKREWLPELQHVIEDSPRQGWLGE
jgi:acetylglutamate synthase